MRRQVRGPFQPKQAQALEAAFAGICRRAQALEDRLRGLELALEVKGLSTKTRRAFREEAIAERHLEASCFPDQSSIHEELTGILAGESVGA